MNILIIDDEPAFRHYLTLILTNVFKHCVTPTGSYNEAMRLPERELSTFDLAFIDMKMPIVDGFQSGLKLKQHLSSIVTIMLTAYPSLEIVINALRDYKFDDFLIKDDLEDVQEYTQLKNALHRAKNLAATRKALTDEYRLSDVLRSHYVDVHSEFIGQSESFIQLKMLIDKVAPTNTTVLIIGETGTGKELAAREIHRKSLRRLKPFIPINCSAIPGGLLESELFGHKKGAFTGAVGNRAGYFKMAEGGTLFLDEIGDMPLELQAKLLRVLEDKQFFPVGSGKLTDAVKVDIRIISATHQDLNQKIDEGRFRQDLLYRLNTIILTIPPLRNRIDDIEPLITHFISQKSTSEKNKGILPEALNMIKKWPYPGNVRELQNMTERAVLLSDGEYLAYSDFSEEVQEHAAMQPDTRTPSLVHNQTDAIQAGGVIEKASVSFQDGHEKLWDSFVKNGFKLWTFDNHDEINRWLQTMVKGAKYIKKGHSGRLLVDSDFDIDVHLKYINTFSGALEKITICFEFQTECSTGKKSKAFHVASVTKDPIVVQPVLKGLPDTYLFNLLYPPARKSDLISHSPQRIIRAVVLRYALYHAPSSTLKSVFDKTMTFLFDRETAEQVAGLSTWGLEAVRAYLCGADHVFSGMARKLKTEPELILNEIQTIFPGYKDR